MIRVGVLTSSRADYGIYLPLLHALQADEQFDLQLMVFGTHLSKFHGYTVSQIEKDGFKIGARIESLLIGDSPNAIATAYALTSLKFSEYWTNHYKDFDIVIALGDRFEMAAAVAASIPFQIEIAHLHGGETTLGAIDNIYRHSISLASRFHFVSTSAFAERLQLLLDQNKEFIYTIGSLSLENLDRLELLSIADFQIKWGIDLTKKTMLVTVHPETVAFEKNEQYCNEIVAALHHLSNEYQIVITMPNADTSGIIFRNGFEKLAAVQSDVHIIENFGTQSYFTCMKYAQLMIGNTSSGIVEAASFNTYVLNLGDRQKGRLAGENVIHLPFQSDLIVSNARKYSSLSFQGQNLYHKPNPSLTILKILKEYHATSLS